MAERLRGKTFWIVGASAGIGEALARELSAAGAELILSARDEAALQDLREGLPGPARILPLDVQDGAAVREAAKEAGAAHGLIYLAGAYWPMKATEVDAEKLERMADVNFTGACRVLGQVLPQMVARDAGHIVLAGSLSGFVGLPGAVGYGASKAALMSLAETLALDLRGTGVRVQVINPGFVRTRLTDKNDFRMPFRMEPDAAARIIRDHMQRGGLARSFPRHFSLLFRAARFLPEWAFLRLFGSGA